MPRISVSDARAVLAGAFAQNRVRTLVAALAIAVGVALGLAVQLVNRAALDELTHGVRTLSGDADLTVRGARNGFAESLFLLVARDREVAVASPVVEVDVRVGGKDETLRVAGMDAFRAAIVQPGLVGETRDRLDTLRPDRLFLSNAAQRALGVGIGEAIAVFSGERDARFVVAGTLPGGARERLAVADIAAVQDAFGWNGRLSRIDIRLRPGTSPQAFVDRIRTMLPAGVSIEAPEATLRATERVSRSYRVNLNVLALVALFTGGLLVFTTQALGVVRRRTQFALLRTLGMTRGRLAALCAAEGALIGVAGSAAGVAAAYAIALRAGDEETALARVRPIRQGLAVIALGVALIAMPPIGGLPLAGYAAIAALLLGALLAMPSLASFVLRRLPSVRNAAGMLALAQLRGAGGQVSVSLAAMVASVSLMVSMAIMVGSFRQSLDDWLTRVLPAAVYARVASPEVAALSIAEQQAVAALAGIERAEFTRELALLVDAARPRVVLLARPMPEQEAVLRLPLTTPPLARPADAPPALYANEAMLDLYGFAPGRIVTLPLAGREARFFVAGTWRDYGRPQGAAVVDRETYIALTGDREATNVAIWLEGGARFEAVRDALLRQLGGPDRVDVASPGEIRALALSAFDRTFAVTYALEIAAVLIGLVGLSSAFGALVLARRREFGVLRHLGMTRGDIATMLASEGVVTASLGVAVGALLGGAISVILVHVVNRQSFHWGMELHVPWLPLAGLCAGVVALATLTAVASGRQAMGGDVVRAVREDW